MTASTSIKYQPYWWDATPPRTLPLVDILPTCDVAVIGAGYTGLSAALTLARADRSVQVYDARRPGEGASTRNGGVVSGNIRFNFEKASRRFGSRRAQAMYAEGKAAREDLYDFVQQEGIACDLQSNGRFTGVLNPRDMASLERDTELLNQHLGIDARIVSESELSAETGSTIYFGGTVRKDIAIFDPAKFHAGLLDKVIETGAMVHGQTPVTSIGRAEDQFIVTTARGATRARNVIVATNGYGDGLVPWLQRRIVPVTSRIIATAPLSENLMQHLMPKGRAMGELRTLYHYFRPSPDGQRILFGGREPAFSSEPERATEHLRRNLIDVFPELSDTQITHSWSGFVAFSRDQLPRLFEHDGIHYACAYCGSGTVWARWLGKKAALRILEDPDGESAFFGPPPRTLPLYRGKPWFLPAAISLFGLGDRMNRKRRN